VVGWVGFFQRSSDEADIGSWQFANDFNAKTYFTHHLGEGRDHAHS
jgi:hypothetical protein